MTDAIAMLAHTSMIKYPIQVRLSSQLPEILEWWRRQLLSQIYPCPLLTHSKVSQTDDWCASYM